MSILKEVLARRAVAESVEQIDELSKKTLGSYVKKATKSGEKHYAKADKEEDKAMSTDGHKYPEKQARHNTAAQHHISKWRNRESGVKTANKKLAK